MPLVRLSKSANSLIPASSMASHSDIDAPKSRLRPSSHRPTRQSMQTFGGGGGGGEGAMNLKDIFYKKGCGQCPAFVESKTVGAEEVWD